MRLQKVIFDLKNRTDEVWLNRWSKAQQLFGKNENSVRFEWLKEGKNLKKKEDRLKEN
jgi:hypothetical protein